VIGFRPACYLITLSLRFRDRCMGGAKRARQRGKKI
jgi:hypothetical protein